MIKLSSILYGIAGVLGLARITGLMKRRITGHVNLANALLPKMHYLAIKSKHDNTKSYVVTDIYSKPLDAFILKCLVDNECVKPYLQDKLVTRVYSSYSLNKLSLKGEPLTPVTFNGLPSTVMTPLNKYTFLTSLHRTIDRGSKFEKITGIHLPSVSDIQVPDDSKP